MKTAKPHPCPSCGKDAPMTPENPWRPFCSERCKMADLGQWFSERYSVPVDGDDADAPPVKPPE